MTVTLNGIALPDLVIENEFSHSQIQARVSRTLGGTLNVWEQVITGKSIDLVGGENFGWISRDVLQRLFDLSAVPNAVYSLSYEGAAHTVRFRRGDGAPIEATPIVARPNQADADWYKSVRIRLMEV